MKQIKVIKVLNTDRFENCFGEIIYCGTTAELEEIEYIDCDIIITEGQIHYVRSNEANNNQNT